MADLRHTVNCALQLFNTQPEPSKEYLRSYLGKISFLVGVLESLESGNTVVPAPVQFEWMAR
ncbi:hypothetical protein [Geomonas silvestris]|nr:hypothetical protein [Geomonas silvestris]